MRFFESEKKYLKAFKYAKKTLHLMKKENSKEGEVIEYLKEVAFKANKNSMDLIQEGKQQSSLKLLMKAEKLLLENECKELCGLINLTYNNMACIHKRENKLKSALACLEKGVQTCAAFQEDENLAITNLNICAILSQLGNHRTAADHAIKAALQCQQEIMQITAKANEDHSSRKYVKELREKNSMLGIAFYNIGVQDEFLGNYPSARSWYEKACKAVEGNPEVDPKLKISFYTALKGAIEMTQFSPRPFNRYPQKSRKSSVQKYAAKNQRLDRPQRPQSAKPKGRTPQSNKHRDLQFKPREVNTSFHRNTRNSFRRKVWENSEEAPISFPKKKEFFDNPTAPLMIPTERIFEKAKQSDFEPPDEEKRGSKKIPLLRNKEGVKHENIHLLNEKKVNNKVDQNIHNAFTEKGMDDSSDSEEEEYLLECLGALEWSDDEKSPESQGQSPAQHKQLEEIAATSIQKSFRRHYVEKRYLAAMKREHGWSNIDVGRYIMAAKAKKDAFHILSYSKQERKVEIKLIELPSYVQLYCSQGILPPEVDYTAEDLSQIWMKVLEESSRNIRKDFESFISLLAPQSIEEQAEEVESVKEETTPPINSGKDAKAKEYENQLPDIDIAEGVEGLLNQIEEEKKGFQGKSENSKNEKKIESSTDEKDNAIENSSFSDHKEPHSSDLVFPGEIGRPLQPLSINEYQINPKVADKSLQNPNKDSMEAVESILFNPKEKNNAKNEKNSEIDIIEETPEEDNKFIDKLNKGESRKVTEEEIRRLSKKNKAKKIQRWYRKKKELETKTPFAVAGGKALFSRITAIKDVTNAAKPIKSYVKLWYVHENEGNFTKIFCRDCITKSLYPSIIKIKGSNFDELMQTIPYVYSLLSYFYSF